MSISVPKVPARAITCPNCGGSVQIRGFAHTLNVVCDKCRSVLDANSDNRVTVLQKAQKAQRIDPKIPMGSRGKFEGVEFEAIGFQRRGIQVEGVTYSWDEYLLFHPYKGFRYLSEYNNHWNYIRPIAAVPKFVGGNEPFVNGQKYKHFQNAVARTSYVVGEFPWQIRVGESATVDDYVAPPYLLSSERNNEEVTWSAGVYTPPKEIYDAFQMKVNPPAPVGVFANQPNPHGEPGIGRIFLMFFMLMTFITMYSCIAKPNKQVFHQSYQFNPASNSEPSFVTQTFELPGWRRAATEIEVSTDVSNNWAAFAIALINDQTGEAFDFGKDVSYYSGVDGGESWTEGSRGFTVTVPEVPPGRYYLRVEPDRDKEPGESDTQFARMVNYEIIVRHDKPAIAIYFLLLIPLAIPPLWRGVRRWGFEQSRWAESDYAPASGGGSDDDE
ncbi:hypothetical protein F183_A26750 [Bryobacterales bacterium F-183]|nr:hypothetical protein F183_A26750 [Bryobacterales bacterium F-183]